MVFPTDEQGAIMWKLAGDAFPRVLMSSDGEDFLYLGNGTDDPYNGDVSGGLFVGSDGSLNLFSTSNIGLNPGNGFAVQWSSLSIAIGNGAQSDPTGAQVAIGQNAITNADANANLAIGNGATASGGGVALGSSAVASADESVAIGFGAQSEFASSVAIAGQATAINQLVLGNPSTLIKLLNSTTGAGTALLGANCPAVDPTAPAAWVKMQLGDDSIGYIPVWK